MKSIIGRSLRPRSLGLITALWLVPGLLSAAPAIALQMTVDTAVPSAGQPVQFTITARNVGADAASGVQVTDQLPAELRIPAGMAAFPSTGAYDAATGVWSVAALDAGASATLLIPAIVANLGFVSNGCDGLRCTFADLPAGASVKVDARSGTPDLNDTKFVTFTFAVSASGTDYDAANSQRVDNISITKTPDCTYYDDSDESATYCFIATAAHGSALEPQVVALRQFRDQYLKRTALGRAFIRFYYRHSPPSAAVITRNEWLRSLVRMLLTPPVLTIAFPVRALMQAGLFAVTLRARSRRVRVTGG